MNIKMIYYFSTLFILSSALYLETLAGSPTILTGNLNQHIHASEPHVAFLCGKPSMHLKQGKWVPNYEQDCLKTPEDILNYCKKMYPGKSDGIVNIEPSSVTVSIENWCSLKEKDCSSERGHTTHDIRPYRCLESPVVSEPLIVSANCHFGHLNYEPKQHCELYDYWNKTAKTQCQKQKQNLESFGVLFPCVKDEHHAVMYFSGVEFVCCPHTESSKNDPKGYIVKHNETKNVASSPEVPKSYRDYLDQPEDLDTGESEHDRYTDVKADIKQYMLAKFKKLEFDLAESQENLETRWKEDPHAAQTMEREIQHRFRVLYKTLADQERSILRQLDDVHQQRVMKMLNTRRDNAIQVLNYVLQEENPQESRIIEALERVIRILEKAKVHSINHFEHLRVSDPDMARKQKTELKSYLKQLDDEIKECVDKLNMIPSLKKSISTKIDNFLASYKEVDSSIEAAFSAEIPAAESSEEMTKSILSKYRSPKSPSIVHVGSEDEANDVVNHHADPEMSHHHPGADSHVKWMNSADKLNEFYRGGNNGETHSTGMVVAVVVAILAAVVLLGVVITIVVRYRAGFNRSHAGYTMSVVELDKNDPLLANGSTSPKLPNKAVARRPQSLGPQHQIVNEDVLEACQLTSMQMTGYENPTYKYFEKSVAAPSQSPGNNSK